MTNKTPTVNAGIIYQGNEIWGHGTDYLWIDAFANLQKQLPNGVILKCCMTCLYGNIARSAINQTSFFAQKESKSQQKTTYVIGSILQKTMPK